jgi:hypothetical protein
MRIQTTKVSVLQSRLPFRACLDKLGMQQLCGSVQMIWTSPLVRLGCCQMPLRMAGTVSWLKTLGTCSIETSKPIVFSVAILSVSW